MRRIVALSVFIAWLAGCSSNAPTGSSGASEAPTAGKSSFAMVTDVGGLGDKSFNDSADRGLLMAQDKLGAKITVLQSRAATDYEPNLSALAQQGNSLIFAIGFLMHDSVNNVAPRFASTHFAIVDSVVEQPNVTSVTFKEEEGSFLAGALAGLVTKKHVIGFMGGIDSPLIKKFQAGFAAGVASTDPKAKLLVKYTGSFDDVAAGKEYASVLFDQGADIIYTAAGKDGLGAIDEAKARPKGTYIIGVDSDQDGLAPGKVLTSVLKRVDNAVFSLCKDAADRKTVSGHVVLGLKDGGIALTRMQYTKDLLPPKTLETVNEYRKAIILGKIVVPSTPAELKAYRPVKLTPPK